MKSHLLVKTTVAVAIFSTLFMTTAHANPVHLPFIGTKIFNFEGGTGTAESIKITKNGTTTVTMNGTQSSQVIYKGKYQNPIPIDGGKYYYRLDGDRHITRLNADKTISKECEDTQGNPKECREKLY